MDPFKILGISRDATTSEIQSAYRKKARKHHPDTGGDAWAFQQVQQAYETILRSKSADKQTPGNEQQKPKPPETRAKSPEQPQRSQSSASPAPPFPQPTGKDQPSKDEADSKPNHWVRHLLTGELPLQNETTTFILVGVLDIFLTYMLLRFGAVEANPIANFFLARWGFNGMIAFKMVSIALVSVIAQVIAQFQMTTARKLLIYGTVVVGIVVLYSTLLLARTLA